MQILIADHDPRDTDLLLNIIKLASPMAECYVCNNSMYLAEFIEHFRLKFLFVGNFDGVLSQEEILQQVRQSGRDIRVVIYSTTLSQQEIDRNKNLGFYASIKKPDDPRLMVDELKAILA